MHRVLVVILFIFTFSFATYSLELNRVNFVFHDKDIELDVVNEKNKLYVELDALLKALEMKKQVTVRGIHIRSGHATDFGKISGDVYIGRKENGVYNGSGTLYTKAGMKLQGEFIDGHLAGEGVIVYSNGDVFKGRCSQSLPNGLGEKKFANGDFYRGNFEYGIISGSGLMRYSNGDVYRGEFVNGLYEGYGILYKESGGTKQGQWDFGNYLKYVSTEEIKLKLDSD